jgi:hypothetical protein
MPQNGANEGRHDLDFGDPFAADVPGTGTHQRSCVLGPPEPCGYSEATRAGVHERLKEANACSRRLGLGCRYRSVATGPVGRSIRIEVYPTEQGGGKSTTRGVVSDGVGVIKEEENTNTDTDIVNKKQRRRRSRFMSVDAFMNSESRLMLQAAFGVGGDVFRAMRCSRR